MLINTRDFGEIEVADKDLFTFPAGIFAFEDTRKYALISPLGEDVYPKWLQSAEDVMPCFIVFDPSIIVKDYIVKLESFEQKLLKLDENSLDRKEVRFLSIATVPNDFKKTTVNLKAPIVINNSNRLATQVILSNDYEFKFRIYHDEEEGGN